MGNVWRTVSTSPQHSGYSRPRGWGVLTAGGGLGAQKASQLAVQTVPRSDGWGGRPTKRVKWEISTEGGNQR